MPPQFGNKLPGSAGTAECHFGLQGGQSAHQPQPERIAAADRTRLSADSIFDTTKTLGAVAANR